MWAKNYEHCVVCGLTEKPHVGKGVCRRCYFRQYKRDNKAAIQQYQHEWYIQNTDLQAMKDVRDKNHFDGNRRQAMERDNYCCVNCGDTDRSQLVVHHVDGKSLRNNTVADNSLTNLQTLCRSCHMKIHGITPEIFRRGIDGWSKKYQSCIECGTTKKRHNGHGLCINCYARKNLKRAFRYKWSMKHEKYLICGTTEKRHEAHGFCLSCYYQQRKLKI